MTDQVPADPSPDAAVRIRRLESADIEVLTDISRGVAEEGRWIGREAIGADEARAFYAQVLDPDRATPVMFVAVVDGLPIGNLSLDVERSGVANLGMLLAEPWRGRGVGSALMVSAIEWATAESVHKLALQVWPHNASARALYAKFGFAEEGRLVRHYRRRSGELWDAIVMGLVLDDDSPASSYS
jgi:RimJ/RimL family protein N-acetyltransferase